MSDFKVASRTNAETQLERSVQRQVHALLLLVLEVAHRKPFLSLTASPGRLASLEAAASASVPCIPSPLEATASATSTLEPNTNAVTATAATARVGKSG